ncbi:MAG: hypothetical protein PVSMB4_01410 [Ktedonobacterales bacterium]
MSETAGESMPSAVGATTVAVADPEIPGPAPSANDHHPQNPDTVWTWVLERLDTAVYVLVGVCFFLAAVLSLGYGIGSFAYHVYHIYTLSRFPIGLVGENGIGATDIIALVSDLLLTLIIMEVLGTVVHHLRDKETTLKPFLFIGIISATRGILAVGARLSVSQVKDDEFIRAMVELGVNAAVIIALGVTMKLIGNLLDEGATPRRTATPPRDPVPHHQHRID